MHEDQLRSLLRNLEGDREPITTFAATLYDRLNLGAGVQRRRRAPWILLAAALLAVLAAGLAVGSGLVRLPVTVDASRSPDASQSTIAAASPSIRPSTIDDASPSASADPTASVDANPSASAEPSAAPDPVGLAGAILFAEADGLRLRSEPAEESDVLATLRRGQLMGATGERQTAAGTDWYEVRIGPGELAGWVAAGPDGDWLRLVEDGAVVFQCYGCTDEGASVVSVTPLGDAAISGLGGEDLTEWRWSPDGSRLVASRGGTTLPYRIVTLAPDGMQLEDLGIGVAAAWSPDGSRLAWLRDGGLIVTDDDLEPSLLDLGGRQPGAPLWSPDGSRLALVGAEDPSIIDPPVTLLVISTHGGPAQQLIEPGTVQAFSWAPDGSRLAFVEIDLSGQQPNRAFAVPADGGSRAPLLEDIAVNAPPTWSPDGTRIATSSPDGLVTANGDGTDARILVQIGAAETIGEVRWSPSGEWLLYTKSSGRNPTMWIVPSDGSDEPRSITPSGAGAQQGEWQPVLVELP